MIKSLIAGAFYVEWTGVFLRAANIFVPRERKVVKDFMVLLVDIWS